MEIVYHTIDHISKEITLEEVVISFPTYKLIQIRLTIMIPKMFLDFRTL